MAKFLLVYHGGSGMASDEEREAAMARWGAWFGALGTAVVDPGNPGVRTTVISPDGSTAAGGETAPTGYSILQAAGHDAAVALAKGCPVLEAGGMVEVVETVDVM